MLSREEQIQAELNCDPDGNLFRALFVRKIGNWGEESSDGNNVDQVEHSKDNILCPLPLATCPAH